MSAVRDVILHYHIFKNAGGSIDLCLREAFDSSWTAYERQAASWTSESNITGDELHGYIEQHPDIRALTSSTARWPEPSNPALRILPIVFLRHPIDRVGSLYHHRRHAAELDVAAMTFAEYVDWALQAPAGFLCRSFQTLFLSDDIHLMQIPEPAAVTAAQYSSAASRLEHLPLFGLLERFAESLQQLTEYLTPSFPELVLRPHHVNWSGRTSSIEARLRDIEDCLGSRRYDLLIRANEADLELYNHAKDLFQVRSDRARSGFHGTGAFTE